MQDIKNTIKLLLKPNSVQWVAKFAPKDSCILDFGGGHRSSLQFRNRPDITYWSLDLNEPTHSKASLNDSHIIHYDGTLYGLECSLYSLPCEPNILLCNHVIEHIVNWDDYLNLIFKYVPSIRVVYVSWPSTVSTEFPSRSGNLAFYDDPTHLKTVDILTVKDLMHSNGFQEIYSNPSYRPLVLRTIGFLLEPLSNFTKRVTLGTREYYGQDSIYIGKKIAC